MTEKNISLDGLHEQLVDINNGVREFSVVILVTPPEDEMDKEYNIGIGTQSQIDNKKEISFSAIKGVYKKSFSHSPVNPEGDPDVFYLIMSSQAPINNIKVRIDLVDNGPEKYAPPPKAADVARPPVPQKKASNKMLYLKCIIAVVILGIGAYFLYKFWKKTKDAKITPTNADVFRPTMRLVSPQPPAVPQVAVPQVAVPQVAVPPVAVPQVAVPQVAVPQVAVPQVAVPQVAVPQAAPTPAKTRMSVESVESPVKRVEKARTGKPTFSFY